MRMFESRRSDMETFKTLNYVKRQIETQVAKCRAKTGEGTF
jgi:hypothetical protein